MWNPTSTLNMALLSIEMTVVHPGICLVEGRPRVPSSKGLQDPMSLGRLALAANPNMSISISTLNLLYDMI